MTDNTQSLQQQISQQATQSAQSFYGNSVGTAKSRIQNDRAQLENLVQQMREGDAKAQVQGMIDSYNELENSMDQAAQDQRVQQEVSQAILQAQQSANGAAQQVQETGGSGAQTTERTVDEQGQITETTFDENGGVVDEATVGNVAELAVEDEYVDDQGRIVSQVRDDAGNAYEMVTDDEGNMIEARAV
jgi:hypothetical protein